MSLNVPDGVELVTDVSAAHWVVERLWPWDRPGIKVGSFVPEGFEAYARVQHVAREEGSLPREQLVRLATTLEPFTDTPERCWYCVWVGWGMLTGGTMMMLVPRSRIRRWWADRRARREAERRAHREATMVAAIPQVRAEGREYLLFLGPLRAAEFEFDTVYQSPNIWWPDDRAWCVATEIDFSWTFVGASRACIGRVLSDKDLDATETTLGAPAVDPQERRG